MADELDLTEVEILETEIRRLKLQNQALAEENLHLRSSLSDLESTHVSLLSHSSTLESRLTESFRLLSVDRDLEAQREEAERLFGEIQEAERRLQEEAEEKRRLRSERDALEAEAEKLADRIEKVTEDNTVIILTLLTTQSDLEADLEKQTSILREFYERALAMVRDMVAAMEEGRTAEEMDITSNDAVPTIDLMTHALNAELAGARRAYSSLGIRATELQREIERLRRVVVVPQRDPRNLHHWS